jgi:hypothetical protein
MVQTAINDRVDLIPFFYKAVRLIALSQASSAVVECVFSQLTLIRRTVGDRSIVGDMLRLQLCDCWMGQQEGKE